MILRFDDVIADALELGALRQKTITLTEEQEQWLTAVTPKSVPLNVTRALLEYYIANKPTESDWCVLPVTNIKAYLGSSALNRMYMKKLNGTFIQRKDGRTDACMFRMKTRTTMAVTAT